MRRVISADQLAFDLGLVAPTPEPPPASPNGHRAPGRSVAKMTHQEACIWLADTLLQFFPGLRCMYFDECGSELPDCMLITLGRADDFICSGCLGRDQLERVQTWTPWRLLHSQLQPYERLCPQCGGVAVYRDRAFACLDCGCLEILSSWMVVDEWAYELRVHEPWRQNRFQIQARPILTAIGSQRWR